MKHSAQVLNHSCVRISGQGVTIYFDPFELAVSPHDADVVFVTHSHYDHYSPDDIARVAKSDGSTLLVAPCETAATAKKELKGIVDTRSIASVRPVEHGTIAGVAYETVAAYNAGKQFHPQGKGWVGYVVEVEGLRYFVAGDTDANPENLAVTCDVALVPCGGTYTFDAREAADFVNAIAPAVAIPTHYGTVVGSPNDGKRFAAAVKPGIEVEVQI